MRIISILTALSISTSVFASNVTKPIALLEEIRDSPVEGLTKSDSPCSLKVSRRDLSEVYHYYITAKVDNDTKDRVSALLSNHEQVVDQEGNQVKISIKGHMGGSKNLFMLWLDDDGSVTRFKAKAWSIFGFAVTSVDCRIK